MGDALFAAYKAGHAVAALHVDPPRRLQYVRIEVEEDGGSGRTHCDGPDRPLSYSRSAPGRDGGLESAGSDAVVTIAGPLCAMWYTTGRFRAEDVLAEDVRSVLDHCLFERKDWERVQLSGVLLHGIEAESVERWLDAMLQRTFDLLARPGFLKCVAAVASELLRKGTLEGSELEALVRSATNRGGRGRS